MMGRTCAMPCKIKGTAPIPSKMGIVKRKTSNGFFRGLFWGSLLDLF